MEMEEGSVDSQDEMETSGGSKGSWSSDKTSSRSSCSRSVISELDGELGKRVELEQSEFVLLVVMTRGLDVDRESRKGDPLDPVNGSSDKCRDISGRQILVFNSELSLDVICLGSCCKKDLSYLGLFATIKFKTFDVIATKSGLTIRNCNYLKGAWIQKKLRIGLRFHYTNYSRVIDFGNELTYLVASLRNLRNCL